MFVNGLHCISTVKCAERIIKTPVLTSKEQTNGMTVCVCVRQTEGEKFAQLCVCSTVRDQDRAGGRAGDRTFLVKDSLSDSGGTFSLSFHGQAASGVDFVLADTEEHDYIRLTAL